jgi:hypothetical protein
MRKVPPSAVLREEINCALTGEIEGVDVSGLAVAVLADTPPLMADGNWRVGMFMDAAASQEQADKLGAVFSGQLGGPMEALSGLISENLGVEVAPIDYADEGRRHRVKIGDFAEIEIEDFVPPQMPEGEVSKLTGVFHPANSTLTVARAITARINAFGLELSHDGKNGHSAPFSWAAQRGAVRVTLPSGALFTKVRGIGILTARFTVADLPDGIRRARRSPWRLRW